MVIIDLNSSLALLTSLTLHPWMFGQFTLQTVTVRDVSRLARSEIQGVEPTGQVLACQVLHPDPVSGFTGKNLISIGLWVK